MNTLTINTCSEKETIILAEQLSKGLEPGDVITLAGDLGAGKTTFTKGLAQGLGIMRAVTSPTFTIIKEYQGTLPLYHMDAYRLEHSDEDIGFDEYVYGDGVCVIEWAKYIEEFLPKERLEIEINQLNDVAREFTFTATSANYEILLENIGSKKGNKS